MSKASESRFARGRCRKPIPGSRPRMARARRASDSQTAKMKFKSALAGFTANRGPPVSGLARVPNVRQWSGTLRRSDLGQKIGTSRHAFQYATAACASRVRTLSKLSASSSLTRNPVIVSAAAEFFNLSRAKVSCPRNFAEINSFEIASAVPLLRARAWASLSRASDGAVGPVTNTTFPIRSSITSEAPMSLNHLSAESVTNPSSEIQTNRRKL